MALKLTTYTPGSVIPPLPGTNTFHSTELFRTYQATPGYHPILIVASEGEAVLGKLLGVVRRGYRRFLPNLLKRCEVYGIGEYFTEPERTEEIFGELLQHLTNEAIRSCFLIEFRNLENGLYGYKMFRRNRYFAMNWLRVRNSLHAPYTPEEWMSTSRLRQIKKGLKNGAEVQEAHTREEIDEFARMLHRNYSSKIRRHFPHMDFFRLLEQNFSLPTEQARSRIFIVTYHGRVIGELLYLF